MAYRRHIDNLKQLIAQSQQTRHAGLVPASSGMKQTGFPPAPAFARVKRDDDTGCGNDGGEYVLA